MFLSEWFWKRLNVIAGFLTIFFLFGLIFFESNLEVQGLDLWLHLAMGKYIVQHLTVPHVDILSCTISGTTWINHEWLYQVLIYFLYALWGPSGIITLQVVIVSLTFLILLLLGYDKERLFAPLFLLLLILLVYTHRLDIRPDMISLLFFTFYWYLSRRYLNKKWFLPLIFFIQILWTNFHGFFILGLFFWTINLAGEWAKRHFKLPFEWNQVDRCDDQKYSQLQKAFVVTLLACFINPNGFEGFLYPFKVFFSLGGASKIFFTQIGELQSPIHLSQFFTLTPFPYLKALMLISLLSFVFNYRKINIKDAVFWIIFLILSLRAARNIVFFSVVAYLVFLNNYPHLSLKRIFSLHCDRREVSHVTSLVAKIVMIVWMINCMGQLSLSGYFDFDKFERKSQWGGVSLRDYPYKAANFLVENGIQGNFFNDFNSGAYLLGRTYPNIKVFIDGRTEVYGPEFFQKYRKIWEGDKELFEQAVKDYQLTGVFLGHVRVPAPYKTARYLYGHKDWVLVYFDYDATIFLKDIPANHKWIEKYRIDLSKWQTKKIDLLKLGIRNITPYQQVNRAYALFDLKFYDQARQESQEALKVTPDDAAVYKILGKIDIEEKHYEKALEDLRKARFLNLNNKEIRYHLGVAFYQLNDLKKAYQECQRVLAYNPKNISGLFLLAKIYVKQGRYDEAMDIVNQLVKQQWRGADDFVDLGDVFAERGQYVHAQQLYAIALKIEPDNEEMKIKGKFSNETY